MRDQIRKLGPDEKIVAPGFYEMPLERHHGQPCDGVSVTSSVLRTMEMGTPADYWAFSVLNPDRFEQVDTPALRIGRAMAAWIEEGKAGLDKLFQILPEDKPNRPSAKQRLAYAENRATDAAIRSVQFWRAVEEDGRDVITHEEMEVLMAMGRALEADPAAAAALGGVPEITMAWKDEETGLWLLSRPDQIGFDGMLSDYKTLAPIGWFNTRAVDIAITQRGYDMQLAFAAEAFERLTGNWPDTVGVVVQYKSPPYHVMLRAFMEEDLRIAQFRNRRALRRFKECLDSGRWPGPGEHVGAYQRPDWQREALLADMNLAGVAP